MSQECSLSRCRVRTNSESGYCHHHQQRNISSYSVAGGLLERGIPPASLASTPIQQMGNTELPRNDPHRTTGIQVQLDMSNFSPQDPEDQKFSDLLSKSGTQYSLDKSGDTLTLTGHKQRVWSVLQEYTQTPEDAYILYKHADEWYAPDPEEDQPRFFLLNN